LAVGKLAESLRRLPHFQNLQRAPPTARTSSLTAHQINQQRDAHANTSAITLSENCGTQGRANIAKIKALILIKCDP